MLNLKNTAVVFAVVLVAMFIADIFIVISPWLYVGIVIVLISLLTWGAVSIQSNFYLNSVCSGDRNARSVSLTFDDGPHEEITPMMLDMLKRNNVKAAFFIVGARAEKNPEILKRIVAEGHMVGGHSYSHHFFFDLFSSDKMTSEMKKTSEFVFAATGKKMRLFRPPYSVTNPTLAKALKSMQYTSVGWSLKSKDTVIRDSNLLLNRLTSNLKKGDVILLHDTHPWTVDAVEAFIHYLKDKDYSILPLDHFINIKAYVN
jgi:peptidoglycan-N-acetylglucosamine deacetylase